MNSLRPEVQGRLCGPKTEQAALEIFDKMQKGLQNLMDAGFNKTSPTRLAVDAFIIKECLHEMPDIFRWARRSNVFPFICRVVPSQKDNPPWPLKHLDISTKQFRDLVYELLRIDQEEFGYTWIPHPPFVASRCQLIYINTVVDVEGWVSPCYAIFENVGNIREKPLEELWNSDLLVKMRNMKNSIKGHCRTCELVDECYGCRCRTYGLTGDAFAADPSCWKEDLGVNNYLSPATNCVTK